MRGENIFDQLFTDERESLVRHAARFGALDPEDAVQEAFRGLLRVGRPNRALLYKIVERRAIDHYRRLAARREAETPVGLLPDLAHEEELAAVQPWSIDRAEFTDSFNHAVVQLETGDREAFVLTELRGLNQYESADVLGVHQSTISRRAERARLTIREELA